MHPYLRKMPLVRKVVKLKDMVLNHLSAISSKMEALEQCQYSIMENQTSLLQGTIYTIENARQQEEKIRGLCRSLEKEIGTNRPLRNEIQGIHDQLATLQRQIETLQVTLQAINLPQEKIQNSIRPGQKQGVKSGD